MLEIQPVEHSFSTNLAGLCLMINFIIEIQCEKVTSPFGDQMYQDDDDPGPGIQDVEERLINLLRIKTNLMTSG